MSTIRLIRLAYVATVYKMNLTIIYLFLSSSSKGDVPLPRGHELPVTPIDLLFVIVKAGFILSVYEI